MDDQKILPIEFMKINNKEPLKMIFLKDNKKLDEKSKMTHNEINRIK